MRKQKRKYISAGLMVLLLPLMLASLLTGCGKAGVQSGKTVKVPEFTGFEELNGKTISMVTGAPFEEMISQHVPEVGQFTYFTSLPDMILAVRSGKSDACLMNNAVAQLAVNREDALELFPKSLGDTAFGIAFGKGDERRQQWQEAYDSISEDEKEAMWRKWTGADESVKVLPEQDWPGTAGTVNVAACDTLEPMSYAGEGGDVTGFDVEMILTMAEKLDVRVNFTGMDFAAVLASVESGKADLGCGSIVVTDERKQAVDFVEYYPASFVLMVRSVSKEVPDDGGITSVAQLNDSKYTVGVGLGTSCEGDVKNNLPNAQIMYIEGTEAYKAVQLGKVDAYACDYDQLRIANDNGVEDIRLLDETIGEGITVAVGISPVSGIPDLESRVNSFIDELRADGTLDDMYRRWLVDGDETIPDIPEPEHPDKHLIVGTSGVVRPFTYYVGTELGGYDIELAKRFAAYLNASLEFKVYDYGAIVMAAHSGDVDVVMADLNVTPERSEAMIFSQPLMVQQTGLMVRDTESMGSSTVPAFADGVKESFVKTFIREERWKLFVEGIGITMLITVLSVIFGTALGYITFMLCRNGNPIANTITRFTVWLVQGMPMVVLLMILYYIIFGNVSISGVPVAIIGFTLVFGASVYGMLKLGVGAVDKGQREAALALGYPDRRVFYRVILPQAIPHVIPVYRGEIVGLIKATAIVGYIAVQDLTRMGDIVRSRTYEAFFPLIAVAVIYFVLSAILTFFVDKLARLFDSKGRSREMILKGVRL